MNKERGEGTPDWILHFSAEPAPWQMRQVGPQLQSHKKILFPRLTSRMVPSVNSHANQLRVANVEKCFSGGEPLSKPGRVLVGEGVLTKV